jgi:N-carbamoyl-L-amino-acid hydrolase
MASHAGTTPMDRRRDAACAVAELVLYVEKRAGAVPDVVGTVGQLQVPAGSINVVPGRCLFSLDLRATTNDPRATRWPPTCAPNWQRICAAPRPALHAGRDHGAPPPRPAHPAWQQRWERAVSRPGPAGAPHAQRRRATTR